MKGNSGETFVVFSGTICGEILEDFLVEILEKIW